MDMWPTTYTTLCLCKAHMYPLCPDFPFKSKYEAVFLVEYTFILHMTLQIMKQFIDSYLFH